MEPKYRPRAQLSHIFILHLDVYNKILWNFQLICYSIGRIFRYFPNSWMRTMITDYTRIILIAKHLMDKFKLNGHISIWFFIFYFFCKKNTENNFPNELMKPFPHGCCGFATFDNEMYTYCYYSMFIIIQYAMRNFGGLLIAHCTLSNANESYDIIIV